MCIEVSVAYEGLFCVLFVAGQDGEDVVLEVRRWSRVGEGKEPIDAVEVLAIQILEH